MGFAVKLQYKLEKVIQIGKELFTIFWRPG
jgi:hypothetical protein